MPYKKIHLGPAGAGRVGSQYVLKNKVKLCFRTIDPWQKAHEKCLIIRVSQTLCLVHQEFLNIRDHCSNELAKRRVES